MIENTILASLIHEPEYIRKVIPYIQRDYFKNMGEKIIFSLIKEHFLKYNNNPTKVMLDVELSKKNLNESYFEQAQQTLKDIKDQHADINWLVDATEDWCKKRAYFNAIVAAADLIEKDDTALYHGSLEMVSKALSVSFDSDLGSDYYDDAAIRFDKIKEGKVQLPTTFEIFNKVTKGGFVNPSLTVFIAPTGVGKSLFLCNIAASYLQQGKNVLYFTMEMSQQQVEQRIDLNLLDMREDQIKVMEKMQFVNRIHNLKKKFSGKLRTKEYPSGSAHSGNFRYFIEELKIKEGFVPDIIIIDYLNICSAAAVSRNTGLYEYMGQIALELRGLGQEFKCPVFTATQTNREGTKAVDFDSTDIADSWGVTHHADYIYGIIETEALAKMNQMCVKRLKDRYNDYKSWMPNFIIGVDKPKQRIYDVQSDNDNTSEFEIDNQFKEMLEAQ